MSKRKAGGFGTYTQWQHIKKLIKNYDMSLNEVVAAIERYHQVDQVLFLDAKPYSLAAENKRLWEALNMSIIFRHNTGAGMLVDATLPEGTPPTLMVKADDAVKRIQEFRSKAEKEIALAFALSDFKELTKTIDLLAVHCSLKDLPGELAGLDEQLSGLYTRLIGAARDSSSLSTELLSLLGKYASARIEGIQSIRKDGGDYLRQIVATTSQDLAEKAQAAIDKARQGRHVEPKTERFYQYGIKYKYDPDVPWIEAARNLISDLSQQHMLDAADQVILNDLRFYDDERDRGDTFKNRFHSAKDSLGV